MWQTPKSPSTPRRKSLQFELDPDLVARYYRQNIELKQLLARCSNCNIVMALQIGPDAVLQSVFGGLL